MAAFDFPSNPSDGDTYTANDVTFVYESANGAWRKNPASATQGDKGQKGQKGTDGNDGSGTKGNKGQKGDDGADGTSVKGQKGESGVMAVNARTSGYSAVASDNGKLITMTTGDLTIGSGIFSAGDAISVANISNAQFNILQGSGTTLYLSGTTQTGNRVLAAKGLCSIICVSSNTFFVSGGGVT